MKRPPASLILSVVALAPGLLSGVPNARAAAVETATAPYVQRQIIYDWKTPDGRRFETALCKPVNLFSVTRSLIYSAHWDCLTTDSVSRVFWAHVAVVNSADSGVTVTVYRCASRYSSVRCPGGSTT